MKPLRPHEAKHEMQAKTDDALEEYWKWVEETPSPTLSQIEDAVLKFRQRIGQAMAQAAIQAQAAVQPALGPQCSHCGKAMQLKGTKDKTITWASGRA
jgi:hypothetical protein